MLHCDTTVIDLIKNKNLRYEQCFFVELLNQQFTEIFSISFDIQSTVNQNNVCYHQRMNFFELNIVVKTKKKATPCWQNFEDN